MMIGDKEILYASLVGSRIVKELPRLTAVQNELSKHVIPPINFLPFQKDTFAKDHADYRVSTDDELWNANTQTPEEQQFFPLSLSIDDGNTWFLLPYEPLISIRSKNIIKRRYVSKAKNIKGSVKERWAEDDDVITITGVLLGDKEIGGVAECFPKDDFQKLRDLLKSATNIQVRCPLLEMSNISHIVVEDFDWPFTKGENVQAYEIKAYSDDSTKLLLDIND